MQRSVPKLRFPGFKDPWELRKLGDIFKEYSEKYHEELPALTIIQGEGTIPREESDRNLQYDKSNLSGYKLVKKDDFIVHLRSFEGGLEKANSDGIISPAYHTLHGESVDSRFYYPYFRAYEFISKKLVAHVYGIRDGRSIDIEGMKTIKIPYTSYEEQKRIGDYLDNLDNLITLHQRKLNILKQYKTGVLYKIFDGFDNERSTLKHYKFNEIFKEYSKRNVENLEQYTIGKNGFKLISEHTYNVSNHKVFNPGSLVVGIGIEEFAISENFSGCCSPVYTTYYIDTDKCSLGYLNQFLSFIMTRNRNRICRKSTRREFEVTSEINDMDLYLPSMSKQIEIAKILRVLDDIIYTYNNQLNQLKQLKTALLQQMFV